MEEHPHHTTLQYIATFQYKWLFFISKFLQPKPSCSAPQCSSQVGHGSTSPQHALGTTVKPSTTELFVPCPPSKDCTDDKGCLPQSFGIPRCSSA